MARLIFNAILCLSLGLLQHRTNAYNDAPCLLRGEPVTEMDDYTYFPGLGSYKFHHVNETWFDARLVCEEEGGHLAIINSADEAQAIKSVFKRAKKIYGFHDVAFCGFHDLFREGEYLTIHGQSLEQAGYAIWNKREPNNFDNDQNCGGIHFGGTLHDLKCHLPREFVCELPHDTEYS